MYLTVFVSHIQEVGSIIGKVSFNFINYLAVNMKGGCSLHPAFIVVCLLTLFCACAFVQKGESVKKMREEVGSPEERFSGIPSMIPVTVAHVF